MKIYLSSGKTEIQLPVLPSSYSITKSNDTQTVSLVTAGEMAVKGLKKLNTIDLSSFFPSGNYEQGYIKSSGVKYKKPYDLVKIINGWRASQDIVRLKITGTDVNQEFLITSFEYGESGGSGDVAYSLSLIQYRKLNVKVTKNGVTTLLGQRTSKSVPSTYTVKKGDTLKSIAKKYLGSSSKYTTIAKLNKISSPYKIKVGQVLKLK